MNLLMRQHSVYSMISGSRQGFLLYVRDPPPPKKNKNWGQLFFLVEILWLNFDTNCTDLIKKLFLLVGGENRKKWKVIIFGHNSYSLTIKYTECCLRLEGSHGFHQDGLNGGGWIMSVTLRDGLGGSSFFPVRKQFLWIKFRVDWYTFSKTPGRYAPGFVISHSSPVTRALEI